jgi:hypothetical protein
MAQGTVGIKALGIGMALTDVLLAFAVALAGAIAFAVWRWRIRRERVTAEAKITGEFKNVFFNRTETDRERMISFWMNRSVCNRAEAMRLAIENWRKDQRSWR